ncbi:hypothetical protein, partial [Roseibium sp. RKSG952]|uniref:hypothetical protein n=1 Tax=Roseibium sp. RKSG952 TaxID=2529384 RepID=UPI001AD91130
LQGGEDVKTTCAVLVIAGLLAGGHPEEIAGTEAWTTALFLGWIVTWLPALKDWIRHTLSADCDFPFHSFLFLLHLLGE